MTIFVGSFADKGGVGKTTILFNQAEYDASQGYNVCLMDGDENRHLSSIYNNYQSSGTIKNIFTGNEDVEFVKIKENLTLIPGSKDLADMNTELATATNRETKFFMWLLDHADEMQQYDRVYIDMHPSMSIVTKNFLVACDLLLCPVEPHKFSFEGLDSAKINLDKYKKEMIDIRTRETLVQANLVYIGNKIKYNTSSSHAFIDAVSTRDDFIGLFMERNLMAESTNQNIPIIDMTLDESFTKQSKSNKDYLNSTVKTMEGISDFIKNYG